MPGRAPKVVTHPSPSEYIGDELSVMAEALVWKAYLRSRIRPHITGRVLEVGAGIGSMTRVLCTDNGPDISEWCCLEPDETFCSTLQELIASHDLHPLCRVLHGDTSQQALSPRSFDTILYVDVLEHVEDDRKETDRAQALLAPGGKLVVMAPAHQWLYSPFDKAIGHFRRYSRTRLIQAVSGPTLVLSQYLDSVGLLASLANKVLLKQSLPTSKQIHLWDRFFVRLSRVLDPILFHSLGKSVWAVWKA